MTFIQFVVLFVIIYLCIFALIARVCGYIDRGLIILVVTSIVFVAWIV